MRLSPGAGNCKGLRSIAGRGVVLHRQSCVSRPCQQCGGARDTAQGRDLLGSADVSAALGEKCSSGKEAVGSDPCNSRSTVCGVLMYGFHKSVTVSGILHVIRELSRCYLRAPSHARINNSCSDFTLTLK